MANQRGIKCYYKLRKAELIQKLEAHPDVNEQVLIPRLNIPRNTTRSVNTSTVLNDPILDDNTPILQPTPKFIAKSMQILNPSHRNYHHANQTLRRATPMSVRNTSPADFVTTPSVLTIYSILNN